MSVYKSEKGREKIRGYYNNILRLFPIMQRYIDTSFGKTFMLQAGMPQNPAIILLHGSSSNSAAWLGDIFALAERFNVFALDLPGEAGNSDENRPDVNSNEYSDWIDEVLTVLGITKAALIGNSMGGWAALRFASSFPNRTSALVMLAPSGIIPPKKSFLDQTEDISVNTGSADAARTSVFGDVQIPKEVLEFMTLVMENFNPYTGALPVAGDEQMKRLTMPVLFIAGANDATMDTNQAAQRLKSLVPHAEIIINESAHVIMNAADIVMPFLSAHL